ncbi:hypothetical protein HY029_03850 [Candidatus Gottesmanbacteria bacterium]|nr:hypothetical protein [Candidatus Gottesmanbacteria bacterium]
MVITILEGEVSEEKASVLINKYKDTIKQIPPEIVDTYLVHDTKNRLLWRIITIWKSKEDLEEMRKKGTPAGVLIFRSAGAEPTLSIYEVVEYSPK